MSLEDSHVLARIKEENKPSPEEAVIQDFVDN